MDRNEPNERATREHSPLTDSLIETIVEKRAAARDADQAVIARRRRPRATRARFIAHVEAYCAARDAGRRRR